MSLWALDVRYAWRAARSRPAASLSIVGVLAAGLTLAASVFALADPFLLRPLPYANPAQLTVVLLTPTNSSTTRKAAGLPALSDWEAQTDLFEGIAAYDDSLSVRFHTGDRAAAMRIAPVTRDFWKVLGIPPVEAQRSRDVMAIVLTQAAFHRVFGADHGVVGRYLPRQDGGHLVIAGILPSNFVFPAKHSAFPAEAITVATVEPVLSTIPRGSLIARLRPGVDTAMAETALQRGLAERGWNVKIQRLSPWLTSGTRAIALGAAAASLFLLIVCAASIANLLVARAAFRVGEVKLRRALGAERWQLARLLALELLLLTVAAVASALLLTHLTLAAAAEVMPAQYAALGEPELTIRVAVVALLSGSGVMIVSAVPVGLGWRTALRKSHGSSADSGGLRALRFFIIAIQAALAVTLLVGAALLVRSYSRLMEQDVGFARGTLVISTSYPPGMSSSVLEETIHSTAAQLERLNGVRRAGATVGAMVDRLIFVGGLSTPEGLLSTTWKQVTDGYFEAVGSRLIAGRFLLPRDANRHGVMISEGLARRGWPNASAVGQRTGMAGGTEVVGVVSDEFNFVLDEPPQPTVFTRLERPWGPGCSGTACGTVSYVLGLAEGAPDVREAARCEIVARVPDAIVFESATIHDRLAGTVRDRSFAMLTCVIFASTALIVCATGLFGVVAFIVGRQTRQIAIRIALGASRRDIVHVVLRDVVVASCTGIAAGLFVANVAARSLRHLMFGIHVTDTASMIAAAALMLLIAISAVALPTARALRLSPAQALRLE